MRAVFRAADLDLVHTRVGPARTRPESAAQHPARSTPGCSVTGRDGTGRATQRSRRADAQGPVVTEGPLLGRCPPGWPTSTLFALALRSDRAGACVGKSMAEDPGLQRGS